MPYRIGLTGGLGCGKSTVLEVFREAGFLTIDTDAIAKDLLKSDRMVLKAIVEHFGEDVLADGVLDRQRLARLVFSEPRQLTWLENLLHPKVRSIWVGQINEQADKNWVVEVPLLFENKLESYFDFCVCVVVSQELQATRLAQRGMSIEDARARIERQMPIREKVDRAEFVLTNNGSVTFLRQQIHYFVKLIFSNILSK